MIDNLLPRAPYRQYVLTFPYSLRFLLAQDASLLSAVHKVVIDRIYRIIRDLLGDKFLRKELFPGSITFLQRFGSLLNLNLHILVLDGAYCRGPSISGNQEFGRLDAKKRALPSPPVRPVIPRLSLALGSDL